MPYLQISTDILSTERSERVKNKRGEIKDRLEPNELLKTQQISKITTPIPISGFYSDEIVNFFDIYGGTFTIKDANVDYNVTVYYYKIKNIELINSDAIRKFWLIFQQNNFAKFLGFQWEEGKLISCPENQSGGGSKYIQYGGDYKLLHDINENKRLESKYISYLGYLKELDSDKILYFTKNLTA